MPQRQGNAPRRPATKQAHLQKKIRKQQTAALGRQSKNMNRGKSR
jgi:hypothetical protein